ncbi:MAG: cupin domain-containing protein [Nitrospinota bacterium]
MLVLDNASIERFSIPGIAHQTLAGPQHGMKEVEVWMQTLAPGAATPVHRHDCEEVVVILRGSGRVTMERGETEFGPNTTLIIPPDLVHQVANPGREEMFLVAAFGKAPAGVYAPDGEPIPLPWRAS